MAVHIYLRDGHTACECTLVFCENILSTDRYLGTLAHLCHRRKKRVGAAENHLHIALGLRSRRHNLQSMVVLRRTRAIQGIQENTSSARKANTIGCSNPKKDCKSHTVMGASSTGAEVTHCVGVANKNGECRASARQQRGS